MELPHPQVLFSEFPTLCPSKIRFEPASGLICLFDVLKGIKATSNLINQNTTDGLLLPAHLMQKIKLNYRLHNKGHKLAVTDAATMIDVCRHFLQAQPKSKKRGRPRKKQKLSSFVPETQGPERKITPQRASKLELDLKGLDEKIVHLLFAFLEAKENALNTQMHLISEFRSNLETGSHF